MIGVAAAIALTLSQAKAMDLQAMDQEGLFNAIVTVTLYQKKCGGDVSPHLKSVLDSMAKSYGIDMFDAEDIQQGLRKNGSTLPAPRGNSGASGRFLRQHKAASRRT